MTQIHQKKSLIVWILGALSTISPFAIDMYLPAFSQIADDFQAEPSQIALSVSSYFIGMAIGQILYGPLLDRFGRKRPLYLGLTVFIVASIGCAFATSTEMLIAFRFIQALGGSVAWVGAVAMVRDFFPVEESARIFSLLILIIGLSPLLAPTAGGFIATAFHWSSVFYVLAGIALLILLLTIFYLPEGQAPDRTISLRAGPMLQTFWGILKHPQFYTYAFSGAFAFSTLFIYVAGSPIVFMEVYHVSPQVYGGIFALLSVGFIGGSQLTVVLNKHYTSRQLFRFALTVQVINGVLFFILAWSQWLDIYSTLFLFFIALSCIGILNPNANALALAPFTRHVGSASALIGCLQIGIAALASGGVGLSDSSHTLPIFGLLSGTSVVAMIILVVGSKRLDGQLQEAMATPGSNAH